MIPEKITVRVTSSGQQVEVKVLHYRAEGIEVVLGEGVHSVRCQLSPARTVRIIVPYPAATPPDVLARIAAQRLNEAWGTPVIVEVRDGAAGTIGTTPVAKIAPAGH